MNFYDGCFELRYGGKLSEKELNTPLFTMENTKKEYPVILLRDIVSVTENTKNVESLNDLLHDSFMDGDFRPILKHYRLWIKWIIAYDNIDAMIAIYKSIKRTDYDGPDYNRDVLYTARRGSRKMLIFMLDAIYHFKWSIDYDVELNFESIIGASSNNGREGKKIRDLVYSLRELGAADNSYSYLRPSGYGDEDILSRLPQLENEDEDEYMERWWDFAKKRETEYLDKLFSEEFGKTFNEVV